MQTFAALLTNKVQSLDSSEMAQLGEQTRQVGLTQISPRAVRIRVAKQICLASDDQNLQKTPSSEH